jgi:hypothetical protein
MKAGLRKFRSFSQSYIRVELSAKLKQAPAYRGGTQNQSVSCCAVTSFLTYIPPNEGVFMNESRIAQRRKQTVVRVGCYLCGTK